MSEVNINYKGSKIAGMDASGTKTLLTDGKYCEDDITVEYTRPSGGGNDLVITASKNGQGNLVLDKTYSEIRTAHSAEKNIFIISEDYYPITIFVSDDPYDLGIHISAYEYQDTQGEPNILDCTEWVIYSNTQDIAGSERLYNTIGANAVPADVANGKTFYNRNGYQVGTASGGSSKNTQVVQSTTRTSASTLTAIGAEMTVGKSGTYDIYYSCFRTNTSASYTWATRLYINGTAYGTAENTTWTNNQQNTHLSNISLTVGDKLRVYGRNTRGTSYYICAPTLAIVES